MASKGFCYTPQMPYRAINSRPARRRLRRWRNSQAPPVSQAACGKLIGKVGSLIEAFECGRVRLVPVDCVILSQATGIPLRDFLTRDEQAHIKDAAELLFHQAQS